MAATTALLLLFAVLQILQLHAFMFTPTTRLLTPALRHSIRKVRPYTHRFATPLAVRLNAPVESPVANEEQLTNLFAAFDKDNDGVLNFEEVRKALEAVVGKATPQEVLAFARFAKIDTDPEGNIGLREFLRLGEIYLLAKNSGEEVAIDVPWIGPEAAEPGPGEELRLQPRQTSKLDANNNGIITIDELKKAALVDVLSEIDLFREAVRPYRRTVFGHPEWEIQRSQDRWIFTLRTTLDAWVGKTIWLQVVSTGALATFLVLYNDYLPIDHPIVSLPSLPWTLSSPALSLLLVFRTNQAYSRWWEARKCWGSIINTCRDLSRQVIARVPAEKQALKRELVGQSIGFARCLTFHLRKPSPQETKILEDHMSRLVGDKRTPEIMACTHKPMTIMGTLTHNLEAAGLNNMDKMKVDEATTTLINCLGICERIFKTPIPLVYTRHSSRFLSIWMLGLPMALYSGLPNHWSIVPIACAIAFFQFGIEELAIEIEEPFSILPLEAMSDGIEGSCMEAFNLDEERSQKSGLMQ